MVALSYAVYANAGTISPKANDEKHIKYGEDHKCVLKIKCYVNKDTSKYYYFASCVLVKPTIIITAAHVVSDSDRTVIVYENNEIEIDLVLYPNSFDEDEKIGKVSPNDIAIGHLTQPIKIAYYPELYKGKDELGKICSISGFGNTGTHDVGCFRVDGNKRAGSNIVHAINDDLLECSLTDNPITQMEFLIAHGDSGGGLFIDNKLAGINSSIYTTHKDKKLNSDYKDLSLHTRISSHIDWLNKMINIVETTMDIQEGQNNE